MKSVRLDMRQEARLTEAAQLTGRSVSDLIRDAIDEHCDRVLGTGLEQRLADVIGSIASGGGDARHTGREFKKLLEKKYPSG